MTFEERVRALTSLGLTPRQTRFITLVALHGGFCLRRHYAQFAGLQYGKQVRDFLDALVARGIARRVSYKHNRGFLYHVHAKPLYRAIAQDDNRNRRVASPALIARRLMLLDVVIARPDVGWIATEQDKVDIFTTRFGVAPSAFPCRTYHSPTPSSPSTVRAFIHKLPIYLAGDPAVPHFVCLADGVGEGGVEAFLRDHALLLAALPAWTLVVVGPAHTADFEASARAFKRFCGEAAPVLSGFDRVELRWYCHVRQAVAENRFDHLSMPDIAKFRDLCRRMPVTDADALYRQWVSDGDAALNDYAPERPARRYPNARLEIHPLPFIYDQFGDLPGVC